MIVLISFKLAAPLLASPVVGTRPPPPLFQLHPSYSDRPPHVGFPAWGGTGGPPLISETFRFYSQVHTSHKSHDPGGLPFFQDSVRRW